jgi:hypothetical protein
VTAARQLTDSGPPTRVAVVTCAGCGSTDEVSLKGNTPGMAARVLQSRGWSLGKRGASKDLCPKCIAGKRRARGAKPDNRTPGQKRTAFLIASGQLVKDGPRVMGVAEVPVNNIMAEVLAPVRDAMKKAAKLPPPEGARPKRSNLSGSGYTSNSNAHASARRFLKGLGIPNAKAEVHYMVTRSGDGTWEYDLIEQPGDPPPHYTQPPQEEIAVSDGSTQAVRDEEQRLAAEAPRQPLPSDNRRILSSLEEHYDADKRRYLKNFSDESVSAKLNVPRAWITAVREQFDFGPDRNETGEAEVRKLKAALLAAENSSKRLLELASEADTITANLRASLAALGVTV